MMHVVKIRVDLGPQIFEINCSFTPSGPLLINLDKDLPIYNPKTGIARCPRCGDQMPKEQILYQEQNLKIADEKARKQWNTINDDTGEQFE